MSASPNFISLFSGAGGLDLGLEQAGWNSIYASDIDEAAVASLLANRGFRIGRSRRALVETFIEQSDIRSSSAKDILAKANARKGSVTLLAGGPPCQSWSSAGHQHGFGDPRGRLFSDFIRIADGIDARWLLLENVRGLLTARGADGVPGSALRYVRKQLLKAGFQSIVGLFNAADYGVAQRRVRLFMVGFRAGDPPLFPRPTHTKSTELGNGKLWISLGMAIAGVGPLTADEIIRPTGKLARDLAVLAPGSGVKSPGKPEATRPSGHWGYKQGAFVADTEQSARTVTANAQQDWIRDSKYGLRRLCPRECAAIQGFPAGWKFAAGTSTQYRLIGNAVPPPMARHLGISLLSHVEDVSVRSNAAFDKLLPLEAHLMSAIAYTMRDERSNGVSRREAPSRRISRVLAEV